MDRREYLLRIMLFIGLTGLALWGLNRYTSKLLPTPPPAPPATSGETTSSQSLAYTTPTLGRDRTTATLARDAATTPSQRTEDEPVVARQDAPRVRLTTDIFDIEFSTRGGVPVRWDVIDPRFAQPPTNAAGEPMKTGEKRDALIEPSLIYNPAVQMPLEVTLFEANARYYRELNESIYTTEGPMLDGQPGWRFTSKPNAEGLQLVKTYRFKPGSYLCDLELKLVNTGGHNLAFDKDDTGLGLQLGPGVGRELPSTNPMSRFARSDVALLAGKMFYSRELKKAEDQEIFTQPSGFQWGAIQGLYYAAVLIPDKSYPLITARGYVDNDLLQSVHVPDGAGAHTRITASNLRFYPSLEVFGAPFRLQAGETRDFHFQFFIGPNQSQILKTANQDLERLLFHDSWTIMRVLALGLMTMLRWFHAVAGNWGIAILLLTFTVRLLLFPFVQKGLKSQAKAMAEQQRLKPLMDKINERYKDDPMRRQQEVMQLFREHGVNPLGSLKGCFWMLIQLPIFFALYKLLSHSIELRGAHFLWVNDLSQADMLFHFGTALPLIGTHFNLLPIIVAVTQMLTSKFMAQPVSDPQQAQMQKMMMYMMPFMVLFFTYGFPAGLMLYWLVSNLWQVLQQIWVKKHMPPPGAPLTAQTIKPAASRG